jgi:DNA-binding LacI/PurR family transcriptional regulator
MSRATVDGVVAIGLSDDHPEVEQIRRAGVPIVLVDSTALPEHGSVEIDDVGGARAAAEHLIGLGHRNVLVIGVEPPAPEVGIDPDGVTSRRLRGYREAFAAVGVDIPDESVVVGPASIDGGIAALNRAWEDGMRPTAVLAMSDAMAIGAMRALRDMRLTIPGDVSVVGFDDIDLAPHVDPPLTTVHQPIRRKGAEAVRLLLSVVQRRDQSSPEHRRLETRLIVRDSTGPAPLKAHEEVAGTNG